MEALHNILATFCKSVIIQKQSLLRKKRNGQACSKMYGKVKDLAETILKKKNEVIRLPNFVIYFKTTVLKSVCYWHKARNMEMECNRELSNRSPFIRSNDF